MNNIFYLFFIYLIVGNSDYVFADDLKFLSDGVALKSFSLSDIKKMDSTNVEYYDHVTRKTFNYTGTPLLKLINSVLSEQVKNIVEIEFISKNGYKAYFTFNNFFKINAILTYKTVDNSKFERFSRTGGALVTLGPYYLVWDFSSIPKTENSKNEDKFQYNSVYQIDQINFITNIVDFGIHNSTVDKEIILGYRTFKRYCLSCHGINHWGGNIGVDFNKSKTLENKGSDYIIKYALDPLAINSKTKMEALPKFKNRDAMAKSIISFLSFAQNSEKYIKDKKIDADKIRYSELKGILNEIQNSKK